MPPRKHETHVSGSYGRGYVTYNAKRERWEAVGFNKGKRVVRTASNKAEALDRLDDLNADKRKGVAPTRETVKDYLASWLEQRRRDLKPTTVHDYASKIRTHIEPAIGSKRLGRLTAMQVEEMLTGIERSPRTVHHVRTILHAALQDAYRLGLVTENVVDRTRAPKVRKPDLPMLTPAQAARFQLAIEGDEWEDFYLLALTCGLRMGELRGLRWGDIDGDVLTVRRSLQRVAGADHEGEPKNGRPRVLLLPERVVMLLEERRNRLLTQAVLPSHGPSQGATIIHDYVFARADGSPVVASVMTRRFQRILAGLGIPQVRFHSLRGYATSAMLRAGMHPRAVMDAIGHTTMSMTLETYARSVPEDQRRM